MKEGDLTTGASKLRLAIKALKQHWEQTESYWQDQKRREFDADYMAALEPAVAGAIERMNRLGQVFAQARNEVSSAR